MLDKTSEKVLKYLIEKSNGLLNELIHIEDAEIEHLGMSTNIFYSACEHLHQNGYLADFATYIDVNAYFILNYKGFSYFEYKKYEKRLILKDLLLSKTLDIIVAFTTAIITAINANDIWEHIKSLLQ